MSAERNVVLSKDAAVEELNRLDDAGEDEYS
jgi:hypothetical protein